MTGDVDIPYKGAVLQVRGYASGWKVFIQRPGNAGPETIIPHTMNYAERDACIAEAKVIVDKLMTK
jgi:hypothetical protein